MLTLDVRISATGAAVGSVTSTKAADNAAEGPQSTGKSVVAVVCSRYSMNPAKELVLHDLCWVGEVLDRLEVPSWPTRSRSLVALNHDDPRHAKPMRNAPVRPYHGHLQPNNGPQHKHADAGTPLAARRTYPMLLLRSTMPPRSRTLLTMTLSYCRHHSRWQRRQPTRRRLASADMRALPVSIASGW